MNLLIDEPPSSIWIGGVEYEINADFRTSILYELLLLDPEIEAEEKIVTALRLFYPEIPDDMPEAMGALLWFYQCGKEPREVSGGRNSSGERRIYSFEFDDGYLYAAFLEQFGIDLNEIEFLHWWKFKALFLSLNETTMIRKIMGYRAAEILPEMSQKDQEFYHTMQELYRIPLAQSEQEKLDAIEEALLNGGDLTGLL